MNDWFCGLLYWIWSDQENKSSMLIESPLSVLLSTKHQVSLLLSFILHLVCHLFFALSVTQAAWGVNWLIFQHHYNNNLLSSAGDAPFRLPYSFASCYSSMIHNGVLCLPSLEVLAAEGEWSHYKGETMTLRPMLWPLVALRGNHADEKKLRPQKDGRQHQGN